MTKYLNQVKKGSFVYINLIKLECQEKKKWDFKAYCGKYLVADWVIFHEAMPNVAKFPCLKYNPHYLSTVYGAKGIYEENTTKSMNPYIKINKLVDEFIINFNQTI